MKKLVSLLLSGALAVGLLAGCGSTGNSGTANTPAANTESPAASTETGSLEGTTLKVGATPAPHAEILEVGRLPGRQLLPAHHLHERL